MINRYTNSELLNTSIAKIQAWASRSLLREGVSGSRRNNELGVKSSVQKGNLCSVGKSFLVCFHSTLFSFHLIYLLWISLETSLCSAGDCSPSNSLLVFKIKSLTHLLQIKSTILYFKYQSSHLLKVSF